MEQVSIWDLLGTPPVEMRKPAPPAVMPLAPASPEPSFPAFTAEDRAAIMHFAKAVCHGANPAHDSFWSAYICKGAVHTSITVPMRVGWRNSGIEAIVRITRTRIGYTSGFWLHGPGYSRGHGGFHHPNRDLIGAYLWWNRQSALQDAASWLVGACQEKALAKHVLAYFEARGIDATESPPSQLRRRLISRQEIVAIEKAGPSAEDLALVDPGPSEHLLAFERAIGVPDDDMPPPELARARMLA